MARPPLARDRWRRADALLGSIVAVAGAEMLLEGGVLGVGIAAAVAVTWLGAGTPYAFVVGQIGLVVGLDGGPTTTPVAQTALVLLLIADVAVGRTSAAAPTVLAVGTVTTAVLLLVGRVVPSTLQSALLMVAVAGVAAYGIHRYERVALGLAGDSE